MFSSIFLKWEIEVEKIDVIGGRAYYYISRTIRKSSS